MKEMAVFLLFGAAVGAAAYFLGCFNGAVIVSKYILHDDVRDHGSGNAGLTNFYRTFGGGLTLVVILCDVLKAVLAVLLGQFLFARVPIRVFGALLGSNRLYPLFGKYWCAVFCLLGHMFPCMFRFKGGKGILSGGTIAIMLNWKLALLVWGLFLVMVIFTRYISLGSISAAAGFPVGTWLFVTHDPAIMILAAFLGGMVIWMHRGNIQRLLSGTENKFTLHRKKEG